MTTFEPHDSRYECTIDDATQIAALMGWNIAPRDVSFSGFWSQGNGARIGIEQFTQEYL